MFVITAEPLDPQAVAAAVRDDAFGAVVVFEGVVRRNSDDDRPVSGLTYEAYDKAAVAEMERIAEEAQVRWPGCRVAMAHRTGSLRVGEVSVVVAAAGPHRPEAFAACEFAIAELKARAAIWKQEQYLDGPPQWLGEHA